MTGAAFSHVVRVDRIPPRGKTFHIEADETERRAIAEALDIQAVEALTVDLDVEAQAGDTYAVRGTLTATVVQTDVVTLDPVRQQMTETVEVTLAPAEEGRRGRRRSSEDATGEMGSEEERDVFYKGEIDLGAIALEHLALGLDPYPRAPGVEFPSHIEDDPDADVSPFAALQRLKRDQE